MGLRGKTAGVGNVGQGVFRVDQQPFSPLQALLHQIFLWRDAHNTTEYVVEIVGGPS